MEKKRGKKFLLVLFSLFFVLEFLIFVSAASAGTVTLRSPIAKGNYSGTFNFSVTTTLTTGVGNNRTYNVTLYCNTSGGPVTNDVTKGGIIYVANISNKTADTPGAAVTILERNVTSIAGLSYGKTYNCSAMGNNGTDQTWGHGSWNITIDNDAPNVTAFNGVVVNNSNHSGTIIFNVTVADSAIGSVYFNITNSSGVQVNWSKATASGTYFNFTFVTSGLTDGKYNVTVYANDSMVHQETGATNLNNTENIQITLDNTSPTGSFSCSPSRAYNGDTISCSCAPTDPTSDINSSATSYTASPSTSNTGVHSLTCSFADMAGNQGETTTTYVIELYASTSSSGSSSTTSVFKYSKTIPQTAKEFSEVQTIETSSFSGGGLAIKERVTFKLNSEEHYLGIRELTSSSVKIELASEPVQMDLSVGQETKVDLDSDGYYDVYIIVNGITNGKADLTINYIHEAVSSSGENSGLSESGEISDGETAETEKNSTWLWIVISAIVLSAIVWYIYFQKRK